jgi:hypothetical protein
MTNACENFRIPSRCNAGISKIPSLTSFLSAVLETHQRNRCAKSDGIRDVVALCIFYFLNVGENESQREIGYQVVAGRESQIVVSVVCQERTSLCKSSEEAKLQLLHDKLRISPRTDNVLTTDFIILM